MDLAGAPLYIHIKFFTENRGLGQTRKDHSVDIGSTKRVFTNKKKKIMARNMMGEEA